MMFSVSDTGYSIKRKNLSAPSRSQTYDLLISTLDALPLSYKKNIKVLSAFKHNILNVLYVAG